MNTTVAFLLVLFIFVGIILMVALWLFRKLNDRIENAGFLDIPRYFLLYATISVLFYIGVFITSCFKLTIHTESNLSIIIIGFGMLLLFGLIVCLPISCLKINAIVTKNKTIFTEESLHGDEGTFNSKIYYTNLTNSVDDEIREVNEEIIMLKRSEYVKYINKLQLSSSIQMIILALMWGAHYFINMYLFQSIDNNPVFIIFILFFTISHSVLLSIIIREFIFKKIPFKNPTIINMMIFLTDIVAILVILIALLWLKQYLNFGT